MEHILDALKMVLLHSLRLIDIQASNERLDGRRRGIQIVPVSFFWSTTIWGPSNPPICAWDVG